MGIFDQDVTDVISLLVPQLYSTGIFRQEWNMTKFWLYMLDGLYQSVISFYFPYCIYYTGEFVTFNGLNLDHRYWMGTIVATIAAIACNFYILIHLFTWDWFNLLFIFLSIIIVFAWTGIWSSSLTSAEYYKSAAQVYGSTAFWACLFVGVLCCLLPRFVYDVVQKFFFPRDVDIIRECVNRGDFKQYPRNYDPTDPDRPKISKYSADHALESQFKASAANSPITANGHRRHSSIFARKKSSSRHASASEPVHIDMNEDVSTEEIPMELNYNADGTPRFQQGTRFSSDMNADDLDTYVPRTSLDRTRLDMLRERQLGGDGRISVENARTSFELPGLTKAETLLSNSSHK